MRALLGALDLMAFGLIAVACAFVLYHIGIFISKHAGILPLLVIGALVWLSVRYFYVSAELDQKDKEKRDQLYLDSPLGKLEAEKEKP